MAMFLCSLTMLFLFWLSMAPAQGESITAPGTGVGSLMPEDLTWTGPGKGAIDSVPLGNGDVGINVWLEANGDVVFYLSKTDAWSEWCRLLKLGRVRLRLDPLPEGWPAATTTRLRVSQGVVILTAGEGDGQTAVRLWVDANHPVVRVEVASPRPVSCRAELEIWRTEPRELRGQELHSTYGFMGSPQPVVVRPDHVISDVNEGIAWFHRNETSIYPDNLKSQGLETLLESGHDPLLHRTFGGLIRGEGFDKVDDLHLASSQPRATHHLQVHALTAQTETVEEWRGQLREQIEKVGQVDHQQAWLAHAAWWKSFWERSWVRMEGDEDAQTITQGYALHRYMVACAGRGRQPLRFNGSIFNVDVKLSQAGQKEENFDADYRRWGGPYWFQNTRLMYWAMLTDGDYELMPPLFAMYRDMLPLAEERTRLYFGHGGAFFPETLYFWGTYSEGNYGFDRAGRHVSEVENTYIRHYHVGALELVTMMLDYHEHTGGRDFLERTLLPVASAVMRFYDGHYRRDERGKLLIHPASSLETWHEATNPTPDIAGLEVVATRLLALKPSLGSQEDRACWRRLLDDLPPLTWEQHDGNTTLAPAGKYDDLKNSENPELYAVFPFTKFGLGSDRLQDMRDTFERRRFKGNMGWRQDEIHAAYLGLSDEAATRLGQRFKEHFPEARFPAFWGPNFDWLPDHDHGSSGMIALQRMLLQTDGNKLRLLPAWPAKWNVSFKLHAPQQTTVELDYRHGRITRLVVTPASRLADVLLPDGMQTEQSR